MRLKTFIADTMDEALAQVRETLGEDALLVAERKDRATGRIEVLAALDSPAAQVRGDDMAERLTRWGGAFSAADNQPSSEHPESRAPIALSVPRPQPSLTPLADADDLVVLSGAPGAGTSMTALKLGVRAVSQGRDPVLIAYDPDCLGPCPVLMSLGGRFGDTHHIQTLADLIDVAGDAAVSGSPVFVDAGSFTPARRGRIEMLRDALHPVDRFVGVLPAGMDRDEAGEIAANMRLMGIGAGIVTRCDLTRRFEAVIDAFAEADIDIAGFGNSDRPTPGFIDADADALAGLRGEVKEAPLPAPILSDRTRAA